MRKLSDNYSKNKKTPSKERRKCTREGKAAVYGSNTLFRVDSVVGVRFNKDGRNGQSGQENKRGESSFGTILAKAVEVEAKDQKGEIKVKTNGYSRNGMPTVYLVNMRDYTPNEQ